MERDQSNNHDHLYVGLRAQTCCLQELRDAYVFFMYHCLSGLGWPWPRTRTRWSVGFAAIPIDLEKNYKEKKL